MQKIKSIGIIGAGPAGIMAAICAANPQYNITLIDKQSKIGGKIAVSGGGQCNYAHRITYDDCLKHYGDNGKFLSHIFKGFFVDDIVDFFENLGIQSTTEVRGKIFPQSKDAKQIINAFELKLYKLGVDTVLNTAVTDIEKADNGWRVWSNDQNYNFDVLVIAAGGASFQQLGTSGDAVKWFNKLGLKTVALKPALTSVTSTDDHSSIAGISLKNAIVSCAGKHKIGELLITHKGYSGPVIHNMSRYITQGSTLFINWINLHSNQLKTIIMFESTKNGSQTVSGFLAQFSISKKLLNYLVGVTILSTKLAELSKSDRQKIIIALTHYKVNNPQLIGFKSAMVTAGGLDLDEVSKKTCRVKTYSNLYAIGEVIDIDGDTGGYNIMAAMSMGVSVGRYLQRVINR